MNVNGKVSTEGLDDIEIRIFNVATRNAMGGKKEFGRTAVEAIANRLGFDQICIMEEIECRPDAFPWLDRRHGSGSYQITPEPESYRVAHFLRKKGCLDETDRERRAKSEKPYYQLAAYPVSMQEYYAAPMGGWQDPYYFELTPGELTGIEQDLIEVFLPKSDTSGNSRFDAFFQMRIKAVAELCRRLGLKPVFDEEIAESNTKA